jgi:hypothetical protein
MRPKIGGYVVAPIFAKDARNEFCEMRANSSRRSLPENAERTITYINCRPAYLGGTKDVTSTRIKKDLVPSIFTRRVEPLRGTLGHYQREPGADDEVSPC